MTRWQKFRLIAWYLWLRCLHHSGLWHIEGMAEVDRFRRERRKQRQEHWR